MGKLKLQVLNGTAKLIAMNFEKSDLQINSLIDGVMDYMFTTGNSFIESDNLKVSIDFLNAKVEQFRVSDGTGRFIDLRKYTEQFSKKLIKNQKSGLKRLTNEVMNDADDANYHKVLIFGKN